MKTTAFKKILAGIIILLVVSASIVTFTWLNMKEKVSKKAEKIQDLSALGIKSITAEYNFSDPVLSEYGDCTFAYVEEADFYSIINGQPVLPVKINTYEFPFGTKIIGVDYEYSKPETIALSKKLSFGFYSTSASEDEAIYKGDKTFPSNFVSYHTGAGLSNDEHKTFLTVRVYPIIYKPSEEEIEFVKQVEVKVNYKEPDEPVLKDKNEYDLLIITCPDFKKSLQPLVTHKEKMGVKTKLVTLQEIKECNGRDTQEQIKYFIKDAIEEWGIKYVLLVGGIKGQSTKWNLPTRYSHVLVSEGKQEVPEPEFISDLYFADIYDSEGNFSSWDTNNNDIFAEWNGSTEIDKMDLYPDVYLGRLPCRDKREVRIIVDKIINYEKNKASENWFKRMILVSGDHWKDSEHISEGVLIMEEASEIMSDFTPVKLYATEKNKLLVRDINKAINKGAGFAYFSGHGGTTMWGIHYPPDATGWAPSLGKLGVITFYKTADMNFLRNKGKLPITVVGGCLNGKFDISIGNSIKKGKIKLSQTNCWAEKLTIKKGGGAIATIANTGLGTHALADSDHNSINDYLEILDGWLELRFFQLYKQEQVDVLGDLHGGAIEDYLNRFLGGHDEMDLKMVQQWELFGDPSLKVGGYS